MKSEVKNIEFSKKKTGNIHRNVTELLASTYKFVAPSNVCQYSIVHENGEIQLGHTSLI